MKAHISVIQLGVADLHRAKQFYGEKLGWRIQFDQPSLVSFAAENGSSAVGLYPRASLADDAGVAPEGSGFSGFTLSYIVRSEDRVDAVLAEAEGAGATIVKAAQRAPWGSYFGYFADLDGYLWKVVTGTYEVDGAKRETPHPYSE
jgi:catechol 2,3-dioxygenase-like lactoylglutathione lyase family enzyme